MSKKSRKHPHQDIQRIYHWIKKRYIIETVYNGKCIGCNSITIKNNLSAFDIHHLLNNIREKSKWENLKHLDIPKIIETLKREKIIALCSNCHRMIKNREFIENLAEIYEGHLNKYIPNIRRDYETILKNINNFKFREINISNPLEKKTIHDVWEDILVAIYKTLEEKGKSRFDKHLLLKLDDITDSGALYRINILKKKGLVETINKGGPTIPAIHRLTKKGIETAKYLINL